MMMTEKTDRQDKSLKKYSVLVAVDFSPYSAQALRAAKSIMGQQPDNILILHVIDDYFVKKCVKNQIGSESQVKKKLFLQAKIRLREFLRSEGMEGETTEELICEGIPFMEINKKALQREVDMVIIGNRGTSGDMQTIFFGSTAERVLRFMKRPVLCVTIEEDRKA
jgi:nucleotide-binding universal stress UspA family protein